MRTGASWRSLRLAGTASALLAMSLAAPATAAPTVTEFSDGLTAGGAPQLIAPGPDGALWFSEFVDPGRIGRILPNGAIDEYGTEKGLTANGKPNGMAGGPDGNLWFTEYGSPGRIGRITPGGAISEYGTANGLTANSGPAEIAPGSDGNLWFTEQANPGRIGRITPNGVITEYGTANGLTANSAPSGIAAGPDRAMWFTEISAIGRITQAGAITEYGPANGLTANSNPQGIAAGPDGNLWFTETSNPGRIGRITPSGAITEYGSADGLTANSQPLGIALGPDGNLWFTESTPGQIGRITLDGAITEYGTADGLSAGSGPRALAAGPDGNVWFTEIGGDGRIGRINTDAPAPTSGNLLRNPGAEEGAAAGDASTTPVLGWATMPNFTPVAYGTSGGFPPASESGRIGGGNAFFAGGPANAASDAIQNVDVSAHAGEIDAGRATANLSGQLGGKATDDDSVGLVARYLDSNLDALGSIAIAPVGAAARGNLTGFVARSTSGQIPAGTRTIQVVVSATRDNGIYNDGSADNLSLTLDIAPAPSGPGGDPPPGPSPGPALDTTLPEISGYSLRPSTFRAAKRGASITVARRKRPPVGTHVHYVLSEPARVTLTVQRRTTGRRKGSRCVALTRRNRHARRCVRFVAVSGKPARSDGAGAHTIRFSGRVGGKALKPGRYRLTIVAADTAANKSLPKRAAFVIAR